MPVVRTLLVASCLFVAAAQVAAQYREGPSDGSGAIAGSIRVTGDVPVLPAQAVFKHQAECGTAIPDERLVAEKNGELRNAVVHLVDVPAGKPVARDRPVKLDNAKCAFVPHVLSATVGQMLEIHNNDPFLHDAHAFLGSQTLFNVAIPKGRTVRKPLAYPGLVHINCNVRHTWMHAYLYVSEHPYHAVTGTGGRFLIDDVPPGNYTLRVWHELLGSAERKVTVERGKTATADIELRAVADETAD